MQFAQLADPSGQTLVWGVGPTVAERPRGPRRLRIAGQARALRTARTREISVDPTDGVEPSIRALVASAQRGDRDAFGALYDHYHLPVYRFLYHRTGSAALAEDLTADTFVRALRAIETFRWQGRDFGAWLMTIARNLALDHFKAKRTRSEWATDELPEGDERTPGPEQSVIDGIVHGMVREALLALPADQRECVVLRFLNQLSIAETAAVLGRSPGAIKQLQHRGIRNLTKLVPVDSLR